MSDAKVITPVATLDAMLDFSNVAEPAGSDPAEFVDATTYAADVFVRVTATASPTPTIATHGIYQSQQAGNQGNDPTTDTAGTWWVFVGSTLRWAMFNTILQDQTEKDFADNDGLDLPGGAGNYANSPDIAAFPAEKITIIAKLTPDDGTPAAISTIFSKYTTAADQRTISLQLETTGKLKLTTSPDGTAAAEITYESTDVSGLADATEGWVKVEFDGDDGVNSVADFYASLNTTDSEGLVEWTQLGAVVTGAQTSLFDSSALLELGSADVGTADVLAGSIQLVAIYDGIDPTTWTIIAEYNRQDTVAGSTSTSLRTGLVWTDQGTAAFSQMVPGIIVQVTPGEITNSAAFMNVSGREIQVIMNDPVDGEVYNQTFDLLSYLGIDTIYAWLFEPLLRDINLVVLGLPSYRNATITAIITSTTTAKCGAMPIGNEFLIGTTLYDPEYGIKNFSQKATNAVTGAVTITPGAFKSVADLSIIVEPSRFSSVHDKLVSLRDTPAVYIANEDISAMIQFAFYNSFNVIYANFAQVVCNLSTEGLAS